MDWVGATTDQQKMLHEIFKFSVTTILVGGAALLYGALQNRNDERQEQAAQAREAKAARRHRLEEFLREYTDAYNGIKFIRRELRNALIPSADGAFEINAQRYAELLRELNQGQLKLEQYRRLLESKPAYLAFFGDEGAAWLSSAEKYLRHVTREYEYRRLEKTEGTDENLTVPPDSRLFQYVVSRKNTYHDRTSVEEHFVPLEIFFRKMALNIEAQD
ncbi:hypothetical protein JMK10_08875 [Rhodovulum sulfidophilum]|uniref:hypothetical protein n=1 Tax=Rhodovulum sulfidophilum TaxID=35806 RepID=UPI0019232750|nr:hypothetical protein [Rhodovulum sulfidophilum]MBL3574953.1 hypothetical protein [Rhodovulum sulfidophilum]MCE8430770.1 hypothetical protein [Rhodovulum sulfidophilum]MCF4116920.1 hypothetical protein [Rhodovulum sulfidophilum]